MAPLGKRVLTVAAGDPVALIEFLSLRLGLGQKEARRWVTLGAVEVDRARAVPSTPLRAGSRVIVRTPTVRAPAAVEPAIVYADDALLAVEKPAGMLSQPSPGESASSLERVIQARYPTARLAHRIDRDASGLVLFGLHDDAYAALQHAFSDERDGARATRTYLAVAAGRITAPMDIRLRIARDGQDLRRRVALPESAPGGQAAHTHLVPLAAGDAGSTPAPVDTTPIQIDLHSGRTHQIRVHLVAAGHPLVGDRLYDGPPAPRLMLHAARLVIPHPATGLPLDLRAPPPPGFPRLAEARIEAAAGALTDDDR